MSSIARVVVDTNIFINNFVFFKKYKYDVKAYNILMNLMAKGKIDFVFSQDTIGELFYMMKNAINYHLKRNKRASRICKIALLFLNSYSVNTENMKKDPKYKNLKCSDPKDDMFLQCVVKSNAKYLISDDLKSKMKNVNLEGTEVLTAKEFVDKYDAKDEENAKDEAAVTEKNIEDNDIEK